MFSQAPYYAKHPASVRSLFPTDVETYNKWADKRGMQSTVTDLRTGGKGLWVGSESAEKILVFFHGALTVLSLLD